jgi:hypothetical protein
MPQIGTKGNRSRIIARREPRLLEAAGTRGLGVSRESDWGGSRAAGLISCRF